MRVLLDENLPHDLIDAFITMDRKLERQQNLSVLPFGSVLVVARSNRVQDLLPLVPDILAARLRIQAGRWRRLVSNR